MKNKKIKDGNTFRWKSNKEVEQPMWFSKFEVFSKDNGEEYRMIQLFCHIDKFKTNVLPLFAGKAFGENSLQTRLYTNVIDDIASDDIEETDIENYFDFVRFGIIHPTKWVEEDVYTEGDESMFSLDIMEITDRELRKLRVDPNPTWNKHDNDYMKPEDGLDTNVYFYYNDDNKKAFDILSKIPVGEFGEDCEFTNLFDEYFSLDFFPVKNLDSKEVEKYRNKN